MKPLRKRLYHITLGAEGAVGRVLLAELVMRDEVLDITWHDDSIRQLLTKGGIETAFGVLRPADGRSFFENLADGLCSAPFFDVEEVLL